MREADDFGSIIRSRRRRLGLTQEELAERAGLSERAIRHMERGPKHVPRKETVQLLADGLGLTEDERAALEAAVPSRHQATEHASGWLDLSSSIQGPTLPPTNLLPEPTPFIGREKELTDLTQLLDDPQIRLVTLTGPGGSGKTRLAMETAMGRLTAYPDGVFWVSLAPLADPALVAPTIAAVLGITDAGERSLFESLERALQQKRLLLVLDNVEHLLEAAPLVGDLLRSCPTLEILVTSRAILHLSAEHQVPVPPLSLPALTLVPDIAALSHSDAVAFFLDRAQAARVGFVLTPENALYVAAICHRLDGLPLALELAAARVRVLPPQVLLERLSRRFDILTGGARDRPSRQQTLRGAVDWSYSLLSPQEQRLLARLSVFVGGWTLAAAEAVCNAEGELGIDVLDGISALVEQSLVRQEGTSQARFGMLETIHEYAAEKLEGRGELQEIQRRHARFFVEFAEGVRLTLDGPDQLEGFNRLDEEHNNLRAAIAWASGSGEVELGLRLAIASELFMDSGHVAEAGKWFDDLLTLQRSGSTPVNPSVRAEALQLAALCVSFQGNVERSRALTEESITLISELSDRREIAYRLRGAGFLLRTLGDSGHARTLFEEARLSFIALGDKGGLGVVLLDLADVAREEGDAELLHELSGESVQLNREIGNTLYVVYALHNLGVAARMLGDLHRARILCEEALELYEQLGMVTFRVELLASLGAILREQGDFDRAETVHAEGLQVCRTQGYENEMAAMHLEGIAALAVDWGKVELAIVLFAAANKVRERIGSPSWPVDRPGYERQLTLARGMLGEKQFTRLWEQGGAMTVDQAIAYALGEPLTRSAAVH